MRHGSSYIGFSFKDTVTNLKFFHLIVDNIITSGHQRCTSVLLIFRSLLAKILIHPNGYINGRTLAIFSDSPQKVMEI